MLLATVIVMPLTHLVSAMQNAWFGFGLVGTDLAASAGIPALWLFRRY